MANGTNTLESAQSPEGSTPSVFGFKIRNPTESEMSFFEFNTNVTGMASEDGSIVINPDSSLTPDEKLGVAVNEASRLFMKENNIIPDFELTFDQLARFSNTVYGLDKSLMRATITGRIISGDPSAGQVTPEQKAFADKVLKGMKKRGKK